MFLTVVPKKVPPPMTIRGYHSRIQIPPLSGFSGKEGGYLEQNFFIRDFLTKKFSGASRRRKIREGRVSGVLPSDSSINQSLPSHLKFLSLTPRLANRRGGGVKLFFNLVQNRFFFSYYKFNLIYNLLSVQICCIRG